LLLRTETDARLGKDASAENDEDDWQVAESKRAKKRRRRQDEADEHKRESRKNDSADCSGGSGNYPVIAHSANARLQSFVKVSDLQNLVLYLLADGTSPQWCSVRHHHNFRKVVVVMVPGLEAGMFDGKISVDADAASNSAAYEDQDPPPEPSRNGSNVTPDDFYPSRLQRDRLPEPLRPFADLFEHIWPIKAPGDDKYGKMHSPLAGMLSAPVPKSKEDKQSKGPSAPSEGRNWQNRRTVISELLATTDQLAEAGYPLHPAHTVDDKARAALETASRIASKKTSADGWIDFPGIADLAAGKAREQDIEKGSITVGRKVLTMDCEMCLISPPGEAQVFRLTRATVVDWNGDVVYDKLVKPAEPITDYLTPYSGITAVKLEGVTTTLADVQKDLMALITPQTILIGHSLDSDLNALQLTFPFIIDTTMLYPHPRGPPLKSSLKWLAQKYLSREIQKGHGSTGHDSVEDARATLDLVKQKCEKGKAWGTPDAHSESIFTRLARHYRPKRDKVHPHSDEEPRLGAVVDWGDPRRGYGSAAGVVIGAETDAEVVAGICRAIKGDTAPSSTGSTATSPAVPQGGCDFIWARLRELEAHRGWWNRTKNADTETLRSQAKTNMTSVPLSTPLAALTAHLTAIHAALPPASVLIVYSGTGDPRPLARMQELQKRFKEEYKVKKWDELSVRWTDVEERKLRAACDVARRGVGFITVT
jgi:RNA exonuclease 1